MAVGPIAPRASALSEPPGLWTCIIVGDPTRGDRLNLLLTPTAETHLALQGDRGLVVWRRLGDWETRRGELSFADARSGRIYTADLDHPTLGGTWTARAGGGSWWCARRPEDPVAIRLRANLRASEFYVPPLVPDLMVAPRYPLAAIRQAREGEAVVCFLVDPAGRVHDAEIVQISDDIFAATTLSAIGRTRYRPTARAELERPGCRAYTYTLDLIDQ